MFPLCLAQPDVWYMHFFLLTEKELSELLTEVFEGYESDVEETADVAADLPAIDVELPSLDNVEMPQGGSSKDQTPKKLRSSDRGNDDHVIEIATSSSQHNADLGAFQYPGHIPPLKYVLIPRHICSVKVHC